MFNINHLGLFHTLGDLTAMQAEKGITVLSACDQSAETPFVEIDSEVVLFARRLDLYAKDFCKREVISSVTG